MIIKIPIQKRSQFLIGGAQLVTVSGERGRMPPHVVRSLHPRRLDPLVSRHHQIRDLMVDQRPHDIGNEQPPTQIRKVLTHIVSTFSPDRNLFQLFLGDQFVD